MARVGGLDAKTVFPLGNSQQFDEGVGRFSPSLQADVVCQTKELPGCNRYINAQKTVSPHFHHLVA